MAYIRKRTVKTKRGITDSYQVLESVREGGKVKKRVLCNLGPYPTIQDALHSAMQQGDDERVKLLEDVGSRMGLERGVRKPIGEGVGSRKKPKRGVSKKGIAKRGVNESIGVGSETKGPKRRRKPKPIPPEAQKAIDEIVSLVSSLKEKDAEDKIIEQVKVLCRISTQRSRYWLSWMDEGKRTHYLKVARKQLSRKGTLPRQRASYDVLPAPPPGEAWDSKYWTSFTLGIIARKVRGDVEEIARRLFLHYRKSRRVGLGQASLVYSLLKDQPDQSLDAWEFHQKYHASDYGAMVKAIKRKGEQDGRSKLNAEKVREIRRRHEEEELSYQVLAGIYGVRFETIGKIVRGEIWKEAV